eukprot:6006947-Amphidinium_carterae.1
MHLWGRSLGMPRVLLRRSDAAGFLFGSIRPDSVRVCSTRPLFSCRCHVDRCGTLRRGDGNGTGIHFQRKFMRCLAAMRHRQPAVLLMRVKGHTAARKVVDRSMHAYELTDQKRAKRTGEARAKSEDAKKHNKDANEPRTKEDASFLGHTV